MNGLNAIRAGVFQVQYDGSLASPIAPSGKSITLGTVNNPLNLVASTLTLSFTTLSVVALGAITFTTGNGNPGHAAIP